MIPVRAPSYAPYDFFTGLLLNPDEIIGSEPCMSGLAKGIQNFYKIFTKAWLHRIHAFGAEYGHNSELEAMSGKLIPLPFEDIREVLNDMLEVHRGYEEFDCPTMVVKKGAYSDGVKIVFTDAPWLEIEAFGDRNNPAMSVIECLSRNDFLLEILNRECQAKVIGYTRDQIERNMVYDWWANGQNFVIYRNAPFEVWFDDDDIARRVKGPAAKYYNRKLMKRR